MIIRRWLVGLFAFVLLLFWSDPSSSMGVPGWVIRLLLIVVLSAGAWFVLKYVWLNWQPDEAAEDRLSRAVFGAIAGALLVGAALAIRADAHSECTERIRTRDGSECVGIYVSVPGPDLAWVFMLVFGAALAFWVSLKRSEDNAGDPDL